MWATGEKKIGTPAGLYDIPEGVTDFTEAVKQAARFAGLKFFKVFVKDQEVSPENASALESALADGIRVEQYSKVG